MQLNTLENGRSITEIWLPGNGEALNTRYRVGSNGVISITLQATYHGDRDEFWAHVKQEDCELSINLKQVTTIVWA